ncbi:acyltransferase family protein [Rhodopseudomonas boonkerdii]|uniref:acyltransferase family protein n=1 Tax=Rhodopseudomonas boonkerdii TaxID=475937 RepID=UPI001E589835|nr:acyltransferase [Rhodopseudomonas boonkerdii]
MQDIKTETRHLDGLRIVAASAVVILHYSDYVKDQPVGHFLVDHTWHFNLFVDLFFVISGYVIASQYLTKVASPAAVGRFLWRRFARIYPLHLATLAFYVAIALALHFGIARGENPARYPFSDIPAQLLLLHAIDGARLTFNFPSWSLSAEFFCYVLFPLMAILVSRRKPFVLLLIAVPFISNTLFTVIAGTEPWPDWINKGGALRALPAFNLGIACYLYRDRITALPALPGLLSGSLVLFIAIGAYLNIFVALLIVYAIALLAIHHDCIRQTTLFSKLGFERWSDLTYSSYMLHIPVATLVLTLAARYLTPVLPGGKLILLPVAVVVLAALSVLSLRHFETPLRRALNEFYDRQFRTRGAAAPLSGQT